MTYSKYITSYIDLIESGKLRACKEMKALIAHVKKCFDEENIYLDEKQMEKYLRLFSYFGFPKIFEWQIFCIALSCCTYWEDTNLPRWNELFCELGRGAGKDGMIAMMAFALSSPYNDKIGKNEKYDVDICAVDDKGAKRPVKDLVEMFERSENIQAMRKFYHWTKEGIKSKSSGASITGYANNPKARDGMRTGIAIFNEVHAYVSTNNIDVFTSGLGKVAHPRVAYFTTNGHIREGVLDSFLEKSGRILFQGEDDNGFLPFICKIDDREEVKDERNWEKANPSYPWLPNLQVEMKRAYRDALDNNSKMAEFMAKRMNFPNVADDMVVTSYDNIKATNVILPDLTGWQCVAGIDYMKVNDMLSVNLHFKKGEMRYDINHSWLCLQSRDINLLRVPWKEWAKEGHLTLVDDVEIHPQIICDYLSEMMKKYQIVKLGIDDYRVAVLLPYLKKIGFDFNEVKNMKLIRKSDKMKIVPVVESAFSNHNFIWGDNPVLRWATNNTKLVKQSRNVGTVDVGNYEYGKIERQRRKNDAFMALVHSVVIEDELDAYAGTGDLLDIGVITF